MSRVIEGQVQVGDIHARAGGLVLSDRINQRVASLSVLDEQASDARRERPEVPRGVQQGRHANQRGQEASDYAAAEEHELRCAHIPAPSLGVAECQHLVAQEDQEWAHLFKGPQRLPVDNWDLDRAQRAYEEKEAVGLVHTGVEAAQSHEHAGVDANHVDHEDIASPSSHHVDVREASQDAEGPRQRRAHGAQPEPEGAADGCHSHRFVVKLPTHRAHQVCRNDGHDAHSHEASIHAPGNLVSQETRKE
mmetsp:Transcript_22020/g.60955  ORF Transcript_22020/g.60955 Transcript_22020/m.60955 type:complete len:249 (+) Transcript_22020:1482-2228(+)